MFVDMLCPPSVSFLGRLYTITLLLICQPNLPF
nr:MAG TPA: hypothetical protein [Caudoviricetes sp.]